MARNGQGARGEHRKTKLEIRWVIIKLSDEGCFFGKRKDKEGKFQRLMKEENHQGARPPAYQFQGKQGLETISYTRAGTSFIFLHE